MSRRASSRRSWLGVIFAVLSTATLSCESDSAAYQRGYAQGYSRGSSEADARAAVAREEGRQAGFKEGYEAAHPILGIPSTHGPWRIVALIAVALGMTKIVLSLLLFVLVMILHSSSSPERYAKIIATTLAVVVVYWLSNSFTLGFSQSLVDLVLEPAAATPFGKLLAGTVATALMWAGLWALETMTKASRGHAYVQTALVLVAASMISILIPLFVTIYRAPNITAYRFFDLILGIIMGGIIWLVHRLLVESTSIVVRPQASIPRLAAAATVSDNQRMSNATAEPQRRGSNAYKNHVREPSVDTESSKPTTVKASSRAATRETVTVDEIVQMATADVPDDIIIKTIRRAQASFAMTPETLLSLKKNGIGDAVIRAMMGPK